MLKLLLNVICALLPICTQAAPGSEILLTTTNTLVWRGVVDGGSVSKAQLELARLDEERGRGNWPIYLVLDSGGGSIAAGDAFIQFAKTIKNLHTITLYSASMAAGIVEALPGIRYITPNGVLMFHRASGSFEGTFAPGELEQQLALWTRIVESMEQVNADRMSVPLAEYKARVINEWWMYGKQAVEQKGADFVVNVRCTRELIAKRETVTRQVFIFSTELTYSGCPLFRSPVSSNSEEGE